VDGSCLTVETTGEATLGFSLSGETLQRTIAGGYRAGDRVNLELPLEAGGRLHGHFVTGHVDCTGRVEEMSERGSWRLLRISHPTSGDPLVVEKGSIAVDGVSLTVAETSGGRFSVALVPETLAASTAGGWRPGRAVNLEYDILGKYVLAAARRGDGPRADAGSAIREYLERG
jgi:riboflavin synthase